MKKFNFSKRLSSFSAMCYAPMFLAMTLGMNVNAHAQNNVSMYHFKPQIDTMVKELASDQCEAFQNKAKIVQGNIQGMGDVVVIAMPNEGCGGGNNWGTALQVFSQDGKQSEMTGFTAVEQMSIRNNRLWITSTEYADSDPHCCPSKKAHHQFVVKDNKLIEVHK
jgi:hypothetical protein